MNRLCPAVLALVLTALAACSSAPPAPEGINDRKNQAADYLKFGQTYYQQGKYQQSLDFFLIALDLNTAVDHQTGMVLAYNSCSTAYLALGKISDARRALAAAEKLEKDLGNPTLDLQTLNGQVQADLAEDKNDQAYERLQKAGALGFPATKEGAILYQARGTVLKNLGKNDPALADFQKSLDINSSLKLKQEMASNLFMIASVQSKAGQYDQALTTLQSALALDREMENTLGIGQDYRALALVLVKKGDKTAAYDRALRSNRVFQSAGINREQLKTLDLVISLAADLNLADDKAFYEQQKAAVKDKF